MDATHDTSLRIAFRVKPDLKTRVEEAAALLGLTVTDFVVSTLAERASAVIERQQSITLSDRDRDRFLEAVQRPGKPIPALVEVVRGRRARRGQ